MDGNGDGNLSKAEQEQYLNDIQLRAEQLLRLSVDGEAVLLIPLEEPRLDLQDAPGVEAHPHALSLAYFARVPETFGVGSTIALDSGLWTGTPLMVSVSTEGLAGIRLQSVDAQGLKQSSEMAALFRVTEARCTRWAGAQQDYGRK